MEYEWSPWIDHDGSHIPADVPGRFCEIVGHRPWGCIVQDAGVVKTGRAFVDVSPVFGSKVLRYRVRRPRVTEWLEQVTSDLPLEVEA